MKPLAQNSMIQNRYLVVQMIGKGGMGEVYLAVDQRLGSAVALKRTMFKENDGLASAFEREAKILGRLRHPVLPKVIDHFTEANDQYLVMEHISGEDLGKRLEAAGKPFPLSWVMFWADQMLDALNYLHSHEPPIIHRDIKPENLKLTDDNHIVLLDFGLSKDFDSRSDTSSLGTGSVVGYSPYFASMEQVRGTGTDARSDIYSFSATIYQLLTNSMPADSLTRADAMLGGKDDPVRPVSEFNPEVSKEVSDVILRGMAVRQENRFDSAAEMQKELRRAFNGEAPVQSNTLSIDATIPAGGEAQTQIIPKVPTNAPEAKAAPIAADEPEVMAEETEMLPEVTIAMDAEATDAAIRQADIQTQVMSERPAQPPPAAATEEITATRIPQDVPASPHPTAPPPPVAKKSRAGLMIGGLVGLLVVLGALAGGGWYGYKNYYLPSQVQATPTPTAEVTVTPTPAPTETPLVASVPTPEASPESTDTTETPGRTDRPSSPGDTRPVARSTPKPAQPAAPKATPKPKGNDRTVIAQ